MTSDQIKNSLMVDRERMGMDLAYWLREVAWQLAVMNEREEKRDAASKANKPANDDPIMRHLRDGGVDTKFRQAVPSKRSDDARSFKGDKFVP